MNLFEIQIEVRDHECDLQGIVNNAVYQNYLEHARHRYLKERLQMDFAAVTESGIHLVVVRAELDYKLPLTSGDLGLVTTRLKPITAVRLCFEQQILRGADRKVAVKARIICAAVDKEKKPMLLRQVGGLMEQFEE